MRCACPLHDVEEPLPRLGVVAGRALQGLDEAQHRGQRRAQLVARIGDEIGAHGLEPPGRGEVAEEQDDPGLDIGMAGRIGLQRADMDLEGPLGRDPLRILDPQGLPRVEDLLDAVEHIRAAQGEGQGMPCLQAGQERVGGLVGLEHHRPRVHQDDGIRDMGQNRLGDARARRRLRLRPDRSAEAALRSGDEETGQYSHRGPEQQPRIAVTPHQGHGHQHEAGHDGPAPSGIPNRGGALPAGIRREVVRIAHGRMQVGGAAGPV